MLETWQIAKSRHLCHRCGGEIPERRSFFSCLVERGAELERLDLCADCWGTDPPAEPFCFWRTRRPASERQRTVDTGLMWEFFERLEGAEEERKRIFRFVLALYLMRRKELKLLEIGRAEGAEVLLFERRSSGERLQVQSPGISEEQIDEAAAQLARLLDAGL